MRETLTNDHVANVVDKEVEKIIKPLLRGWFHAVAAIGAVILTILLCWLSRERYAAPHFNADFWLEHD